MSATGLIDSDNRRIRYLRVSVTDRCNLRCRYCIPSADFVCLLHSQVLTYEEIVRTAGVLAPYGVSSLRLTGGEPLVRKGLDHLVSSLASIPGIKDLSLTTNGILLGKYAESLKKAGLSRVNVSLDTLKSERFSWITDPQGSRSVDDLKTVLDGLEAARRAGLRPIKVNVVLMKGFNDDELEDFAGLTLDRDWEVRFIEFMPLGPNGFWNRDRVITAAEIASRLRRSFRGLEPLERGEGSGPATRYRIPGHKGAIGFITPVSSHFCATCNRLRLTADGKLRTCLFSDHETDLIPLLRGPATDGEILKTIREAIRGKPRGHGITSEFIPSVCARTMSHIGG